jgi:hypothetical protein
MIIFKSIGHFFATAFQKVVADVPKIESGIQQVEDAAPTIEAVTAKLPVFGPLAVPVEKAGFAVLGELAAVLTAAGDAGKAKLQDAGLDIKVIATVEDLLKSIPQLVALAKTL